jgi:hypothetical protein
LKVLKNGQEPLVDGRNNFGRITTTKWRNQAATAAQQYLLQQLQSLKIHFTG